MKRMNFPRRKEKRQKEAVERQKAYDKLSTKEKLARAKKRPGNSTKEIERLKTKPAEKPKKKRRKRKSKGKK